MRPSMQRPVWAFPLLRFTLAASVLFAAGSMIAACSDDPSAPADVPDAGEDAEPGLVCDTIGLTKGPWALAVTGDSAILRWEACRAGVSGDVTLKPEMGGADIAAKSVETPFEVKETFQAPLNPAAPPDWAGTYFMHEAKLTSLSPGTCYLYELGADPSRKGRFCTARPAGDPIRFMAIGDTNPALGDYAVKVLAQVLPKKPDFIIHGGDIQYYDSTIETWAYWFSQMQPMLSAGAFFPAIGNHEDELPGELGSYYMRFFGGASDEGTNEYYRFQSGGVYFFSLDTEQSLDLGSPQGTWLSSKLDEASKSPGYRFSVVFFHKPLLTCGDTGDNPSAYAQLEPLFMQYKVPLVLQAHMHGYERFEINGITYITTAGGGGALGNVDENDERTYCAMRVASGAWRHGLLIDISATEIKGSAIDQDGVEKDAFTKTLP